MYTHVYIYTAERFISFPWEELIQTGPFFFNLRSNFLPVEWLNFKPFFFLGGGMEIPTKNQEVETKV